ncbi:cohesin domain-containing protein [Paenibacillus sp. HW567]|uniref:cohesin domain-containing protein n=1 Tax=Paenibacillus sp. HW567 TaxID=1034769 RepID=UPI000381F7CB|nr:cohesin domain-containing protein [Paenibacillus sp. HW567]
MKKRSRFKKYFKGSGFLTLIFSMFREISVDNTPPVMSVEVTTDRSSYAPGEEVTVLVHLRDFIPNDPGYSYLNFIVQYDSAVFDNSEYLQQSVYKKEAYTSGNEVNTITEYNFMSPVDGSIYLDMNTSLRGIDIQVEANTKQISIPAVDQTLVTFKLRVREHTLAASSTICLANEFTRIRTSEVSDSFYLYSPDVAEIAPEPVAIIPSPSVSVFSLNHDPNRLA